MDLARQADAPLLGARRERGPSGAAAADARPPVRGVPHSLREAALALGYPRWRTSLRIVVRTALTGIVTGCLVGVARVAGETAPLLFTSLGNLNFTTNVLQPMQTLSLQIFTYATGPFEDWHRLAWAAAVVLMGLVLILATSARWAIPAGFVC